MSSLTWSTHARRGQPRGRHMPSWVGKDTIFSFLREVQSLPCGNRTIQSCDLTQKAKASQTDSCTFVDQSRDRENVSMGDEVVPAYTHELPLTPHVNTVRTPEVCWNRPS